MCFYLKLRTKVTYLKLFKKDLKPTILTWKKRKLFVNNWKYFQKIILLVFPKTKNLKPMFLCELQKIIPLIMQLPFYTTGPQIRNVLHPGSLWKYNYFKNNRNFFISYLWSPNLIFLYRDFLLSIISSKKQPSITKWTKFYSKFYFPPFVRSFVLNILFICF